MTELRDHKTNGDYNKELEQQLIDDILTVDVEIFKLREKKGKLQRQLLSIQIKPFNLGGYALVLVPSGKSFKEQKCLLEEENGLLYARPLKSNGILSSRHFRVFPKEGGTYADYLKEVKE